MNEDRAKELFHGLIQALEYLHSKHIIHRDIKPDNILVHDNTVKIIDFGLSVLESESSKKTGFLMGTDGYMPPEAYRDGSYCTASDIWSAGVTLYQMLTGGKPFSYKELTPALEHVHSFPDISHDAIDLLVRLLQPDHHKRPTASEILDHPWLEVIRIRQREKDSRQRISSISQLESKMESIVPRVFSQIMVRNN